MRIAVIGSGPSAISFVDYLTSRLRNVEIDVYERFPIPGGIPAIAIPKHRVKLELLVNRWNEICRNRNVDLVLNTLVTEDKLPEDNIWTSSNIVKFSKLLSKYDYVVIASGAWRSRKLGIPGEEFCIPALKLLTNIKLCNYNIVKCVDVGDEVVVIGAGRTAVDVVDTLLRQGVKIYLVYRRSIVESRAYDLLKKFLNYVSIIEKSTTTQVMRSGNELLVKICKVEKLNDKFKINYESCIDIQVKNVILAIGELPSPPILKSMYGIEVLDDGRIKVNEDYLTSNNKVLAIGDVVLGPKSIPDAVVSGIKAARTLLKIITHQ